MERKVNGRDKENRLYKALSKYNIVYRFNENRWTPTPADLIVFTKRHNILIEVKAGSKQIPKSNIRPAQIHTLTTFESLKEENKAVIAMYFRYPRPSWHIVPIEQLSSLPSIIRPSHVQEIDLERFSKLLAL